jgi:hypothetical protein
MSKRLRTNEDRETIAEYKQTRPQHTAAEWIEEALYIATQHCEDHDIAVSNFLYCALDALKASAEFRAPIGRILDAGIITKEEAEGFDYALSQHYRHDKPGRMATLRVLAALANGRPKKRGGAQ